MLRASDIMYAKLCCVMSSTATGLPAFSSVCKRALDTPSRQAWHRQPAWRTEPFVAQSLPLTRNVPGARPGTRATPKRAVRVG